MCIFLSLSHYSKQIEELRQQLSSRTLTEVLLSKALSDSNEEKRKWKLETVLKTNEIELLRAEGSDQTKTPNTNPTKINTIIKEIKHPDQGRFDMLEKYSTKLKELQSQEGAKSSSFDTIFNRENFVVDRNPSKGILTPIADEIICVEDVIEENNDISNQTDNSIIVLDDDHTNENRVSNETNIHKALNEIENTEDHEIEELRSVLRTPEQMEDDKENALIQNSNIENNMLGKKVTFAEATVSPKKSGLRRCKKVIVCKPTIISCKPTVPKST